MKKKHVSWVSAFLITLLLGAGLVWAQGEIRVGAINDMTGGTADVGKDYALGTSTARRSNCSSMTTATAFRKP